ncbi:hypothetical protein GCM10011571_27140 [Marinithermofilum abyssi]|uniref:Isochorismatase-like domain-containing protein n=1 Tax=Marinithermofilum abyssi TaxID=1571185 RepID=A0A8J2VFV4_9BACL|nr:isochorismatase family protein [Marinithermofilum abyssi]GGE23630.1 hypothetical protein GCM10011571_27140 [Marinithermofilum abyssi]
MNKTKCGSFTEVHHEVHHEVHNERHYENVDRGWFKIGKPTPEKRASEPQPDSNCTVLVYMDQEYDLTPALGKVAASGIMKRMTTLGRMAEIFQLPTIITLLGTGVEKYQGFLGQKLHSLFPSVPILTRTEINAWDNSAFVQTIRRTKCKSLVLAGIGLDPSLVVTALTAASQGYRVFVVIGEDEKKTVVTEAAIQRLIQAGVWPISWMGLAFYLQRDWSSPTSTSLIRLFSEYG